MAIYSSILAWKIRWTEEPGGLKSMGFQRVRHDLATKHAYSGLYKHMEWSTIYLLCCNKENVDFEVWGLERLSLSSSDLWFLATITSLSLSFLPATLTLPYFECQMFNSVQFSHSVMSDSLKPHGLQHTRLPCPSPTAGACSNSCPLSRWCHPTISSSVVPFTSCLQSFLASGSFPVSQFFTSGGQSIGVSASASVLPMNIQDWFPLGWTDLISLQSKGLSRVFSNTKVQRHQFFGAQLSL